MTTPDAPTVLSGPCPSCEGRGYDYESGDWSLDQPVKVACPDCAGTGKAANSITASEKVRDGGVGDMRDDVFEAEMRETLRELGISDETIEDILTESREHPFGHDARDSEDEYPHGGRA